jgi:hypothetical protein
MTDERIERLVFNGISGVTGTYGLSPVTSEELAAHILPAPGGAAADLRVLERQLQRDRAQKISAIVDLLAESSLEDADRDAAWQEAWLGRLADLLANRLLGGDYTRPEQVKRLADRLRRDPKGKVVAIVTCLAEDKAQDLAKLLLVDPDEAPDNTSELKERMKLDALLQLGNVRNNQLTRSLAEGLEGDPTAQRNWLETFLAGLRLVPIQALNSLKETRGKVRPLEPLTRELDALANAMAQPSPWLEGMCQELSAQPKAMTWIRILDMMGGRLGARIDAQDDPLRWTDLFDALRRWLAALDEPVRQLGVIEGVDPNDLSQAGWGIIFPYEDPKRSSRFAAIEKQLEPLLALRKSQAGPYFQVYKEGRGYRPGDTASQFLARYGARPSDPADPAEVPYYLLLVGSPEEIPFPFQQQLDVQYAVGRIDFDDLEAYARYARSVVAVETGGIPQARRVAFFAPANPGDDMTKNSVEKLVEPLYERLKRLYGARW